jgi:hypothetical protein
MSAVSTKAKAMRGSIFVPLEEKEYHTERLMKRLRKLWVTD